VSALNPNVWPSTVDKLNYLQQFLNPKGQLSILHAAGKFEKIINPETK